MAQKAFNIAISCIGSGVGQSVINSLRLSRLPIKTIGLGNNPFAYGAYDCDIYDYTPGIYDADYIDKLIIKCREHRIDLLIPGLDDDVLIISQNIDRFNEDRINVVISDYKLVAVCRDKEKMSHYFSNYEDVFVKTYNKYTLEEDLQTRRAVFPFIAKPRGGCASRGVEIIMEESDLPKIKENHILQELALPNKNDPNYNAYLKSIRRNENAQLSEVSIQLVFNKEQELMGKMFSYNKLANGVPIEIVPYDNEYIWSVIDNLTPTLLSLGLRGPLNIQGRLTDNGLKLFEMNPRFTGITGLRALMGFNEVEACVKEWLNVDKGNNKLQFNYNRFGVRQTEDKSIPVERNREVYSLHHKINGRILKERKTLLITGACGYLGQNLIKRLLNDNLFEIRVFDLDKNLTNALFSDKVTEIYDNDDLKNGIIQLGNIDILIHLGFTRPHGTKSDIADSLRFTHELFTRAVAHHIPVILNISSQSVYGQEAEIPRTENTSVAPETVYAQAKYATELLLSSLSHVNKALHFSSLRLGTLAGGSAGLTEVDFLSKFVKTAMEGKLLNIKGGMQEIERLDIRDAVDAISTMLYTDSSVWKPVYNVSSGEVLSLLEIAQKTTKIVSNFNGGTISEIKIEKKEIKTKTGMDSSLFYSDMKWKPKYQIEDTIESLAEYFTEYMPKKINKK